MPKRVATPLTSGCVPGTDIATVWTCPTPVYTHTARLCTNNTHSQGHRAVCPSATHMSIRKRDRTKRLRRYQGCPLAKPASQNRRWYTEGKGITIGWAIWIIMNHWGVSSCCTNPPVAMAHHRNDANTPRNTTNSYLHPPEPPQSTGVTIVAPTTAIATHNLAGPVCPSGSQHH